jgi:hypothetical protein
MVCSYGECLRPGLCAVEILSFWNQGNQMFCLAESSFSECSCVSEARLSLLVLPRLYQPSGINEYGTLVEWYQWEFEVLIEEYAPMSLCPQKSHIDYPGIERGAVQWEASN